MTEQAVNCRAATKRMGTREQIVSGPEARFLKIIERAGIGKEKKYHKGEMLFWQGDPLDYVYVVSTGVVKVYSVSQEGRSYAFGFIGQGGMIGVSEYLLGNDYTSMAEVVENSRIMTLTPSEFEKLLADDPEFSSIVMHKLAQGMQRMVSQVKELGFLDVQQRLKQRLMELAQEYGIKTREGIRIDLEITHEEIGELVSANRATITAYLNEFKRQGYLWKDGRFLVIVSPEHMEVLDHITEAVIDADEEAVTAWCGKAVDLEVDPLKALEALSSGMRQVDRMLIREEIDISDVILSAYVMKSGLNVLNQSLKSLESLPGNLGTVVIGTVHGDIHDIGRTMVSMLMTARGFNVIDLGINVPTEQFVEAVRTYHPDILGMSSLMTTTSWEQERVIEALKEEGLDAVVMTLIGGGGSSEEFSKKIGATGWAPTAQRAVELAFHLVQQDKK